MSNLYKNQKNYAKLKKKGYYNMLSLNYEFRKGIFFIRIIGELNEKNYLEKEYIIENILLINKFKYIVINTNYLEKIDLSGINYLLKICTISQLNNSNLIICDKNNIFSKLLNYNIPSIKDEIEIL